MADPNIQTLIYPLSPSLGAIKTYQTEVNKKTGASVTYDITNLGQKDAVIRSDPEVKIGADGKKTYSYRDTLVDSYKSTFDTFDSAGKSFIINKLASESRSQRAAYINKNFTQDQKNNLFPGMPKVQHTALPASQITPGGSTASPDNEQIKSALENPQSINIEVGTAISRKSYKNLYYPTDLEKNKQDRIKFSLFEYVGATLNPNLGQKTITRNFSNNPLGSVTLPIQPSISDSNSVDWSGATLNAVQALGASASLNLMQQNNLELFGRTGGLILEEALKKLASDKSYGEAFKIFLAQEAVGAQNLLSRASGAILNPNLELLFNGPSLRPFNFTFRLSPRDNKEATQVKQIIRFFKQGMSVKSTEENVFLKAPNIFNIRYITYDDNNKEKKFHPSINVIKKCALLSCDVDYTPDGTYMTYKNPDRSMTSYQLSLRFSELEPIYDSDYKEIDENEDTYIGY